MSCLHCEHVFFSSARTLSKFSLCISAAVVVLSVLISFAFGLRCISFDVSTWGHPLLGRSLGVDPPFWRLLRRISQRPSECLRCPSCGVFTSSVGPSAVFAVSEAPAPLGVPRRLCGEASRAAPFELPWAVTHSSGSDLGLESSIFAMDGPVLEVSSECDFCDPKV